MSSTYRENVRAAFVDCVGDLLVRPDTRCVGPVRTLGADEHQTRRTSSLRLRSRIFAVFFLDDTVPVGGDAQGSALVHPRPNRTRNTAGRNLSNRPTLFGRRRRQNIAVAGFLRTNVKEALSWPSLDSRL
jgi:hypothetical protein